MMTLVNPFKFTNVFFITKAFKYYSETALLFFGGKKKYKGLLLKYLKIALATFLNSESGIFLERNASPSDKLKLTIKLTRPISPIPITDQKNICLFT